MRFRRIFTAVFSLQTTIAVVVFGLVLATIVVAVALSWRRRRRGRPPSARAENNPLELTYLLALAGMAIFLVVTSFSSNSAFWAGPRPAAAAAPGDPPAAPLQVRVTAFQWCWQFSYPGRGMPVTGRCAGGPVPTLVLPAGRPVEIELTSRDVIHSFWLPGLRFKMDIYPGHVNHFRITLPVGRWLGRCAQFCGLYHYGMTFHLQALPAAQFSRWLRQRGGHSGPAGAP